MAGADQAWRPSQTGVATTVGTNPRARHSPANCDHDAFASRTRTEWGELFDREGIVWGPVAGYDEVVRDPQSEAIGLFPTVDSGTFGEYRTIASPIRIRDVDTDPDTPSPRIGQHTRTVLADAGFDDATIAELIEAGVVTADEG